MTDGQPANISYSLRENEGAEMDACILSYDEILNTAEIKSLGTVELSDAD